MARTKNFRRAATLVSVLLVFTAGATAWWCVTGSSDATTPLPDSSAASSSVNVTAAPEASCDMDFVGPTAGKPCKPCKDRPWCECTYNGAPRISCNPCCYDTQPYPTCLD